MSYGESAHAVLPTAITTSTHGRTNTALNFLSSIARLLSVAAPPLRDLSPINGFGSISYVAVITSLQLD